MKPQEPWHQIVRLVWIAGGVVALNEPGAQVEVQAGFTGRTLFRLTLSSYGALFEALRRKGLPIVGVSFFQDPDELQGFRTPEFRAIGKSPGWPTAEAIQQWRDIAHAASKRNRLDVFEVASRIASGLRYSSMRLLDVATAYSDQLRGYLHRSEPKEFQRFKDTNAFTVYKAIHALFWEMSVLRDALAEFAARHFFSAPGVRFLSKLLPALRKNAGDPLADQLLRDCDADGKGWLATFTEYRNLFTHLAPMEHAAGIAWTVQDMLHLAGGGSIPQIYYPLPADVHKLVRDRSQGALFKTFDELIAASSRHPETSREPDALLYLHECVLRFTDLALAVAVRSPVPPERLHLGDKDIIGGVRIVNRDSSQQ